MIEIALAFAFGCFGLAALFNLYRIVMGPNPGDRILALDTLVINAIALIALYDVALDTQVYFEASMLIAMTGFVSTVSYARYILRGDVIE
ncbi:MULTISPECIES: K+/H+ antiporter subunit F [unclassified Rhodosalinus]|uniref:K+/H+ antiporter subunit F n=1 Tax=unclassified Rhodosalinus TaxID=2630183 RepID=UPI003523BF4C